jgi:membrane-associated phospholipid phosphatase
MVLLGALLIAPPALAQTDTLAPSREPPAIRWWHGAIVAGGLSALMLLDEPTERYLQRNRSGTLNDMAKTVRHFGQVEVYGTITLGLVAAGLIGHEDELTRAGGRLAATLALAGATSTAFKYASGRPRPSESTDADVYAPFSGDDAMPSGHSTVAFALATSLADDIHRTWASVGLYTLATGVAWSRLNDNRHWLSDVAAGAVLGVTSAKLVNGRWRLFHLRPPSILLAPSHAAIAWQITF